MVSRPPQMTVSSLLWFKQTNSRSVFFLNHRLLDRKADGVGSAVGFRNTIWVGSKPRIPPVTQQTSVGEIRLFLTVGGRAQSV